MKSKTPPKCLHNAMAEVPSKKHGRGQAMSVTPKIQCPACRKRMEIGQDGIAGDFYAQCRNNKCDYDGWSADTIEGIIHREVVNPIGKQCYPGILHAQDMHGNCLICTPGDKQ